MTACGGGVSKEKEQRMRVFIAVQLSDEMKAAIIGTMHELKKAGVRGSFVPAQNLHLTLAFIGEIKDIEPVKAALEGVKAKPFKLSFSEMNTFGDLLWVGLKGNQGLSALAKEVRAALDRAGIAYDSKKFVPHITIVRNMSGSYHHVPAPKGEMMVKRISVMKSEVRDGKRVYTELHDKKL